MQFGGWTQFGGAAQFGGGESRALLYYRALKSLALPGLWSQDDDALINQFLRVDAVGLSIGQLLADRLEAEIFPHVAAESLPDWETMLGLMTDADATLAQRRAAVLAVWQGAKPASLPVIRQLLAPLLNPERLFVDEFDDAEPSWRYEQSGLLGGSEAGTLFTLTITALDDARWEDAAQQPALVLIPLVDGSDDTTVNALVDAWPTGSDAIAGITLYLDDQNAVMFAAENGQFRLDKIVDGVLAEGSSSASPAAPCWLQLTKEGNTLTARYGSSLSSLTELDSTTAPFRPKKAGMFARNTGALPGFTVDFDTFEISHARPENNVEVIEQTLANLADAGATDENIFFAFVHRNPGDDGEYDLARAQRVLDKISQAHTVLLCGESDSFLCDDDESLCDRDVLGRWFI